MRLRLLTFLVLAVLTLPSFALRRPEASRVVKVGSVVRNLLSSEVILEFTGPYFVVEDTVTSEPSSPEEGHHYLVGSGASLSGAEDWDIIYYSTESTWEVQSNIKDDEGVLAYIKTAQAVFVWNEGELKRAIAVYGNAEDLYFDSASSTLISDNVQDAVDELDTKLENHADDLSVHFTINDTGSSTGEVWSASKVSSEILAIVTAQFKWGREEWVADGTATFTLAHTAEGDEVIVRLEGTRDQDRGDDYTFTSSRIVTFTPPPPVGYKFKFYYLYKN